MVNPGLIRVSIEAGKKLADRINFDNMSESQVRLIANELASHSRQINWLSKKVAVKMFFENLFNFVKK